MTNAHAVERLPIPVLLVLDVGDPSPRIYCGEEIDGCSRFSAAAGMGTKT
jgi:hypothetical protein